MSTTKKKRRDPHAGRKRGSLVKTGKRGGGSLTAPHGAPRLSTVAKVLLGKGMLVNVEKVGKNAYLGATQPSSPVYNREQIEENKRLYPHLFEEQPRRGRVA